MRARIQQLLELKQTQNFVIGLILLSAVLLGLETSDRVMQRAGVLISVLDQLILSLFVLEIGARIYAYRSRFWRDPWSIFDFLVVAVALVPASGSLAVLRSLRVLRVLRLLTVVPAMRRVVGALLSAIPGLGSIMVVLAILYYVFAVIATNLFGDAFPQWFGHLGRSLYTLFQVMTLESWSMGIVRPVMEQFPYAWVFFVPFILIVTFSILNLFIAIIVNAMQSYTEAEHLHTVEALQHAQEHIEADLQSRFDRLLAEMQQLRDLLQKHTSDTSKKQDYSSE